MNEINNHQKKSKKEINLKLEVIIILGGRWGMLNYFFFLNNNSQT